MKKYKVTWTETHEIECEAFNEQDAWTKADKSIPSESFKDGTSYEVEEIPCEHEEKEHGKCFDCGEYIEDSREPEDFGVER